MSSPNVDPAEDPSPSDTPSGKQPAGGADGKHTAVVYFHGMGSQRRYEEVSRLVDALDIYANSVKKSKDSVGVLTKIRARLEPGRPPRETDVSYVRVYHRELADPERHSGHTVRFYEAYWAPLASDAPPTRKVLGWLARQVTTPLQTLRNPWRARQRLRRASLIKLAARKGWSSDEQGWRDICRLLEEYDRFEGPEARREFPKGRFKDFLEFLRSRLKKRPGKTSRIIDIAGRWRHYYIRSELFNLAALASLIMVVIVGVGAAVAGALAFLGMLTDLQVSDALRSMGLGIIADSLVPNVPNAATAVVTLAVAVGIARFLRDYMGDVQQWTTYEETNCNYVKRDEILKRGTQLLMHVLNDENCDRVVVIGHSLGSTIANDALLELGRYNRARHLTAPMMGPLPLEKIEHFVTMGSPIDKVHYFFESHQGKYHRYVRVVNEVRGDTGYAPFAKNRKPHIHWVNFWDPADIVSGTLETPVSQRHCDLQVDNVLVSSFWFPFPGASHSAYFNHRDVIRCLCEIVFKGRYRFADAVKRQRGGIDYAAQFVQVNDNPGPARLFQAMAMTMPWLLLTGVGFSLLDGPAVGRIVGWGGAALVLATLVVTAAIGKLLGHKKPLADR